MQVDLPLEFSALMTTRPLSNARFVPKAPVLAETDSRKERSFSDTLFPFPESSLDSCLAQPPGNSRQELFLTAEDGLVGHDPEVRLAANARRPEPSRLGPFCQPDTNSEVDSSRQCRFIPNEGAVGGRT